MERVDPPKAADEKTMLAAYLDYQRATMLLKVAGLSDEQVRFSPVPSGTSLFGLLAHLAMVERWWFTAVMGDAESVSFPQSDSDPDADWRGPDGAALADVVALYESECSASRAVLAASDLDALTSTRRARHGWSVRAIALHMIEETARHAGHADLIRELVDGAVGEQLSLGAAGDPVLLDPASSFSRGTGSPAALPGSPPRRPQPPRVARLTRRSAPAYGADHDLRLT